MQQFLLGTKATIDQISTHQIFAAGAQLDYEDTILYILNGLPNKYHSFKAAIRTRAGPNSLDELYSLLLSKEINLVMEKARENAVASLYSISIRGCGGPFRARGRSFFRSGHSSNSPPNSHNYVSCQICHKPILIASDCWHHINIEVSLPTTQQNCKAHTASNTNSSCDWILDTTASSHMTFGPTQLQNVEPFKGSIMSSSVTTILSLFSNPVMVFFPLQQVSSIFLKFTMVSWKVIKQHTVARSTTGRVANEPCI